MLMRLPGISLLSITLFAALAVAAPPAAALPEPRVSADGRVYAPKVQVVGDKQGRYTDVSWSMTRGSQPIRWSNGKRLRPGKYTLTATVRSDRGAYPRVKAESTLWNDGNLNAMWDAEMSPVVYRQELRTRPFSYPASWEEGRDSFRHDEPDFRFWPLEYSSSCGGGYWQPYYPCYTMWDESGDTREVPLADSRVIFCSGDSAPPDSFCDTYYMTSAVLVSPDGPYWFYPRRSGAVDSPYRYFANATMTYTHKPTRVQYQGRVERTYTYQGLDGEALLSFDEFRRKYRAMSDFPMVSLTLATTRDVVVDRQRVKFIVK